MFNFSDIETTIIFIDDEKSELEAYSFLLQTLGIKDIITISDSRQVMSIIEETYSPIVFLDLTMPHKTGQEVLEEIKEKHPHIPVIICTANSEIETAVECLRLGAHDYLVKPISMKTFGSALRNALEINSLRNEVLSLKGVALPKNLRHPQAFSRIITQNPVMLGLFQYIDSVSTSGQPVLILGETGSGKELIARAVHDASRVEGEFVAVDVSGLDDTLFSDSLFGHEKGAYTGAIKQRSGLIEKAHNGTLFLDEIGDLNEASQIKLLRLVQEGVYYPLGTDQAKKSSARIVTATNMDLNRLAGKDEQFRRDLYYRLSTHLVKLPPLRERKEDIPLLVDFLVSDAAASMGKHKPTISKTLMLNLVNYSYPGNIRELKTYITDAVAQCENGDLSENAIMGRLALVNQDHLTLRDSNADSLEKLFGKFPSLFELSEYAVYKALEKTNNNQSQAAQLLGISKQALNKRINKKRK